MLYCKNCIYGKTNSKRISWYFASY
jgi:hypothetical protein